MWRRGFTLVELLVAIFISAIMFAIGYGVLNQALGNRVSLAANQARLTQVQGAMRLFVQDFAQLAPRPVRALVGDGAEPALRSEPGGDGLVTLTRGGWANPAGLQRPALQRVRYRLENGELVREHWLVMDALLGAEPVRREILDGVTAVRLRFMDSGRAWQAEWPGVVTGGDPWTPELRRRPIAVEVTLELADFGVLTRLIEVPG